MARKKAKAKAQAKAKSTPHRTLSKRHPRAWTQEASTPSLTLADEARWMSNNRSAAFETGKKLRHLKIEFVSAGLLQGTIKENPPQFPPDNMSLPASPLPLTSPSPEPSQSPDNAQAMADMNIRSPSPSSSEDEIVFKGRGNISAASASTEPAVPGNATPPDNSSDATLQLTVASSTDPAQGSHPAETPADVNTDTDSDTDVVVQDRFALRRGGKGAWEGFTTPWESRSKPGVGWLSDDANKNAAMDDYMQNVEDFGLKEEMVATSGFARREMDLDAGSHNDWNSDTPQDLDDSSTSSDGPNVISRSHDRHSVGGSDDDDENDSENDTDTEEELDMDDELVAKILQKQEELGLGSDEVVLYPDDDFFSSSGFERPNKRRQHRSRRVGDVFPSASAMADAIEMDPYHGFDIMDTDRPSLRRVKKGRHGQPPPELDDFDLNEQLKASWEADRAKKRLKKAEREELRKQGLLGRKGKAPDLRIKYRDGVNLVEAVEDIRDFLMSEMQTLSLPPMEAHRRATIHQFVSKLGLNSKSRGDGANRFTVLSKTLRTVRYDEDAFDALVDQKKFKFRMRAVAAPQKQKAPKVQPKFAYKDGDTVGASAPELGPENKGRAMLEKMGWAKGMALGALDNKGILQPITHTVKMTKAGLR
ncbi:hypothetical protein BS50DRAFT_560809 [Corynespora cassiicola Philippines]|uniref:Protein SQS1 n=1 Tax=Corynespora cassiicola Philippines TaxID=1448308 RepID=A0A2T2NBW1_CORCC|nr:hypothetical protein BS50DRAFT_560809 [Corynespora cassiicola Philippines]